MPWGPNLITGDSSTFEGGVGNWTQVIPFDTFEISGIDPHGGLKSLHLLKGPPITERSKIILTTPTLKKDNDYWAILWCKNVVGKINFQVLDPSGNIINEWKNITNPIWAWKGIQFTPSETGTHSLVILSTDPPDITEQRIDDISLQKLIPYAQYLPVMGIG